MREIFRNIISKLIFMKMTRADFAMQNRTSSSTGIGFCDTLPKFSQEVELAEYRSIYVEDRPVGPAVGELDVISSEPPEKLNQSPPASIELARCQKGGLCEVHGPLGPNSEGLNTTLKMFDGARDEFERAVIHVPFNRLQGSAAAYATETHQGGHAPVVVVAEFSNNGDTVTIRTTPITQYGRWPHEPTTRTFNRVPNDPGPKVAA